MRSHSTVARGDIARRCLAVLAVAVAVGTTPACAAPGGPRAILESGGRSLVVQVELADTPEKRERGLMFRKELPDDRGMLFVFEQEGEHTFWMKNTLIPLDMIVVDGEGRITGFVERARPLDLRGRSGGPARYVLEVPGGWVAAHGVRVGDRMRIVVPKAGAPPTPSAAPR